MIEQFQKQLFAGAPDATLYHYTSLQGLMGIIESKVLRASDVRYMNDSTELTYALSLIQAGISSRQGLRGQDKEILSVFSTWLRDQINKGPMLFSASFRANGNLLSQWRGYASHGKGMSLGFNPRGIQTLALEQGFSLGRCIYDPEQQSTIIEALIDKVLSLCSGTTCVTSVLDRIEGDLLSVCALFKHPAFAEEQEWRLVSQPYGSAHGHPIAFREGKGMLVPYYAFGLELSEVIQLDHVFVGPTPNADLSVNALAHYLALHNARPERGISECEIPYRQR